jgi:hypothetical protein
MSVPPSTRAPQKQGSQLDRAAMQTGQPSGLSRPAGVSTVNSGNIVSRPGILTGLAAGFLGAGVFGWLAGGGVASGLVDGASIVGLFLQIALVVVVALLIWMWWSHRHALLAQSLSPRELADAYGRARSETSAHAINASASAAAGPATAGARTINDPQR